MKNHKDSIFSPISSAASKKPNGVLEIPLPPKNLDGQFSIGKIASLTVPFPDGSVGLILCDQGSREEQEDHYGIVEFPDGTRRLMAIDGMGGHQDGEQAAAVVAAWMGQVESSNPDEPISVWTAAIGARNALINAFGDSRYGPGAVLVLADIKDDEAKIFHLGDARATHLRDGQLIFLTADNHQKKPSDLSPDAFEAEQREFKTNIVESCIGAAFDFDDSEKTALFRRDKVNLVEGDILFLMSDGVHELYSSTELLEILMEEAAKGSDELLASRFKERILAEQTKQISTKTIRGDNLTILVYVHKMSLTDALKKHEAGLKARKAVPAPLEPKHFSENLANLPRDLASLLGKLWKEIKRALS